MSARVWSPNQEAPHPPAPRASVARSFTGRTCQRRRPHTRVPAPPHTPLLPQRGSHPMPSPRALLSACRPRASCLLWAPAPPAPWVSRMAPTPPVQTHASPYPEHPCSGSHEGSPGLHRVGVRPCSGRNTVSSPRGAAAGSKGPHLKPLLAGADPVPCQGHDPQLAPSRPLGPGQAQEGLPVETSLCCCPLCSPGGPGGPRGPGTPASTVSTAAEASCASASAGRAERPVTWGAGPAGLGG